MEKVNTHVYEPEEEPEGEFINCKWCGKPVGLHERMRVGDNDQGIYPKYVVFKHPKVEVETVGGAYTGPDSPQAYPLEHVEDFVFVLKPLKDPAARVAMAAYAEAVYGEKPQLAQDMWEILGDFHGS